MATIDYNNQEKAGPYGWVQPPQVHHHHHPQIIIENPRNDIMKLSYCEIHQKNKPQSNSIAGGKTIKSLLFQGVFSFHSTIILVTFSKYSYCNIEIRYTKLFLTKINVMHLQEFLQL